jgi:hypothetical protein
LLIGPLPAIDRQFLASSPPRIFQSSFFWYVTIMIGLSLIVYVRMPDTKRNSLIRED